MSTEITTLQKQTYQDGLEMLAQQMPCKLHNAVRLEKEGGKRVSFPQIGVVAAKEKTTRHGDTQYVTTPHRRRWVPMKDFELADLLDVQDLLRIVSNPGSDYSKAFVAALNRARDKNIIEAALGTAYTGEDGTATVTLPVGQQIAAGGTGFTLDKVRTAMQKLKAGNAVDGNEEMFVAWTSAQEAEFINTTEVKSIDYNNQRVLVSGGLDGRFFGFTYIRLEDWTDENGNTIRVLPKASGTRSCAAWVKSGLLHNIPMAPQTKIDQLPGKSYAWQFYAAATYGSTRMQESKVVQIDVLES